MVLAPNWQKLQVGDRIDVVVRAVVLAARNEGVEGVENIMHSLDSLQRWLVVTGPLVQMADHYAMFGLVVTGLGSRLQVSISADTVIHALTPPSAASFGKIVDLCCGMGCWSLAAQELGLKVVAGVDSNPRWEPLFHALHQDAAFVQGDIGDTSVLSHLHHLHAARAIVIAGVSCQPYSKAGDRRGMTDDRASSLPRALKAAWMLQSPVVILECVPDVLHDRGFQEVLTQACMEGGFHLAQHVLKLQDVWCARRERWFGVLTAIPLGKCSLADLPLTQMHRHVKDVMPYVKQWAPEEEAQLTLSLYELCKFYDFACGGIEALYLRMDATLPTTLHSIGNQLYACACGCRPALSLERLAARGLFGVLIPLAKTFIHENMGRRDCRYPHPKELMLLNGGPPDLDFGSNHKLAMSGIGQCVSPLQGLWVLAGVVQHCHAFLGVAPLDPVSLLESFMAKILTQRDAIWPVEIPMAQEEVVDPLLVKVAWYGEAESHEIKIDPMATIQQLLRAEMDLTQFDGDVRVYDAAGRRLDECSLVAFHHHLVLCPVGCQPVQSQVHDALMCPCSEWEDQDEDELTPTVPYDVDESDIPGVTWPIDASVYARDIALQDVNHLFRLGCPQMVDQAQLMSFVALRISAEERRAILAVQGQMWADDEVRSALCTLVGSASEEQNAVMWDPLAMTWLVAEGKLGQLAEFVSRVPAKATVVSALVLDRHWYPLVWRCDHGQVFLYTCDASLSVHPVVEALHRRFCEAWTCPVLPVTVARVLGQLEGLCGAMAVAYVDHLLHQTALPDTLEQLRSYHMVWRLQFDANIPASAPCPWIWGRGEASWKHRLEALLQEHGVAHEQSSSRAKMVIDKLGEANVTKALSSQQAWRDLKWHANSCVPPVQLIQPQELQRAIERRTAVSGPIGRRAQKQQRAKGKGKGKSSPMLLDPAGLRVESGLFHCGDGQPLSQLDVASIRPNISGIFLLSLSDAGPYLKAGKILSAGGLGMLLVDCVASQVQTELQIEPVRFPAVCLANAEPLLIEGVLCQLGNLKVQRMIPSNQCSLVSMATCVARVLVFRDLVEGTWDSFREHPMRYIFSKLPILRPCNDPQCVGNCEAWHPAESCDVADPLLEVWSKSWMSLSFNPMAPAAADTFSVHVRLPVCLQHQLQHYSGLGGLFLEPRQVNGRTPSDRYYVIWLAKTSYQELMMLKQSTPDIIGLARLGHKYGVRCLTTKAQELHALLRPGGSFLPAGKKLHFSLGPVPYGTLRSSIVEVLAAIPWVGRPLQPMVTPNTIGGVLWKIQAVEPPPVSVVHTDCGELVISRLDEQAPVPQVRPAVVASNKTLQLCTNVVPQAKVDTLQLHDPWEDAHKKRSAGGLAPGLPDPVVALEQKVVESVLAKLPKANMEVDSAANEDAMIARVDLLERKVNELHDGQCRIQAVVTEQGKQHGHQIQRLETAVSDNVAKLGSFQNQFQKQLEQQQSQLDGLFKRQMEKLEDLLAKKARRE